jgi:hypothetical protein
MEGWSHEGGLQCSTYSIGTYTWILYCFLCMYMLVSDCGLRLRMRMGGMRLGPAGWDVGTQT